MACKLTYIFIIMVLLKTSITTQFDSNRDKSYQEQLADSIENIELPDEALSKINEFFYNISLNENPRLDRLIKLNMKNAKRSSNFFA